MDEVKKQEIWEELTNCVATGDYFTAAHAYYSLHAAGFAYKKEAVNEVLRRVSEEDGSSLRKVGKKFIFVRGDRLDWQEVAKSLRTLVSEDGQRLSAEQKEAWFHIANCLGPNVTQGLYHAVVFATKVA